MSPDIQQVQLVAVFGDSEHPLSRCFCAAIHEFSGEIQMLHPGGCIGKPGIQREVVL